MNLNKAIIVGRVTQDPEVRTTTGGTQVANYSVATNRFSKGQDGQRQEFTEYHNIVAWGRLAEISSQYLQKGALVMVEGRLQTRNWEGQDGVKRYRTEIVAENMQLGPRGGSGGGSSNYSGSSSASSHSSSSPDEIPTIQQDDIDIPPASGNSSGSDEVNVDDIPF